MTALVNSSVKIVLLCLNRPPRPQITFRCTYGDFYVALGSSMSLALLVWVGGGLLKRVLFFFGNDPSLGRKSPMLHLPPKPLVPN